MNQPFAFNFLFRIDAGQVVRGDGLTFVLLAEPGLGQAGSGLGYQGLSGVAFAIDTFNFESEPESPSLQILKDGVVNPPHAFFETTLGNGIRAGEWAASVSYTPSGNSDETGTLLGTISHGTLGLYSVSAEVDMSLVGNAVFDGDGFYIGREVFYGFTAANGLADDGHLILTAVPEPSTYVTVLAGLGLLGWRLRRRRAPQA
jgi:hypothetical protein